jgi:hypothetical protein
MKNSKKPLWQQLNNTKMAKRQRRGNQKQTGDKSASPKSLGKKGTSQKLVKKVKGMTASNSLRFKKADLSLKNKASEKKDTILKLSKSSSKTSYRNQKIIAKARHIKNQRIQESGKYKGKSRKKHKFNDLENGELVGLSDSKTENTEIESEGSSLMFCPDEIFDKNGNQYSNNTKFIEMMLKDKKERKRKHSTKRKKEIPEQNLLQLARSLKKESKRAQILDGLNTDHDDEEEVLLEEDDGEDGEKTILKSRTHHQWRKKQKADILMDLISKNQSKEPKKAGRTKELLQRYGSKGKSRIGSAGDKGKNEYQRTQSFKNNMRGAKKSQSRTDNVSYHTKFSSIKDKLQNSKKERKKSKSRDKYGYNLGSKREKSATSRERPIKKKRVYSIQNPHKDSFMKRKRKLSQRQREPQKSSSSLHKIMKEEEIRKPRDRSKNRSFYKSGDEDNSLNRRWNTGKGTYKSPRALLKDKKPNSLSVSKYREKQRTQNTPIYNKKKLKLKDREHVFGSSTPARKSREEEMEKLLKANMNLIQSNQQLR